MVFHWCWVSFKNNADSYFFSTDIWVGIDTFKNGHFYWCAATFSIIFISGYIIAFYSFYKSEQFKNDEKRKSLKRRILHIFLLGPVQHFWKFFKNPIDPPPELEKDVLKIKVLEGILEALPQLMLQVWIHFRKHSGCLKTIIDDPKDGKNYLSKSKKKT